MSHGPPPLSSMVGDVYDALVNVGPLSDPDIECWIARKYVESYGVQVLEAVAEQVRAWATDSFRAEIAIEGLGFVDYDTVKSIRQAYRPFLLELWEKIDQSDGASVETMYDYLSGESPEEVAAAADFHASLSSRSELWQAVENLRIWRAKPAGAG